MFVIADDITGAAEIAGIAFARGEKVHLLCAIGNITYPTDDIVVIATDTRSMSEAEAVAETRRIGLSLIPTYAKFFKKTDSALRGHVVAELAALMEVTGFRRAIYEPANPSKGRTIRAGIYYIDKTPIDRTDFSFDPEHPATTANLRRRFPDAASKGIFMPDATNQVDLHCIVNLYDDGKTLFAGAADVFEHFLGHSRKGGSNEKGSNKSNESGDGSLIQQSIMREPSPDSPVLILCGSTQSKVLDLGIPVAPMPRAIYDGADDLSLWDTHAYAEQHSLILNIPHTHRTGKDVAVHLRSMMAEMTRRLVAQCQPTHLIIEGGATAWATLQALGWKDFTITAQLAPGVVQMRATNGVLVTLKPGSYPWGDIFQSPHKLA